MGRGMQARWWALGRALRWALWWALKGGGGGVVEIRSRYTRTNKIKTTHKRRLISGRPLLYNYNIRGYSPNNI